MRAGLRSYAVFPPLAGVVHLVGESGYALLIASTIALPFTLAGAMFPDLDAKRSIPFRHFRRWVAIFAAALVAIVVYNARGFLVAAGRRVPLELSPSFVGGTLYSLLVLGTGYVIFRFLYVYNPPHRGILHQIPAGLLVSSIIFSVMSTVAISLAVSHPVSVAALLAVAFLVGYLSHLYVDTAPDGEKPLLLLRKTYIGERLDERFP